MSSTSNAQNLLVNVFRPTYVYQAGVGYTPSLVISNVDKLVATSVVASNLVVNDPASNTYIGSNAGNPSTEIRASSNNVAIGFGAGTQFSNTSNTVAVGFNALGGVLSNVNNTVAVGANTIGGGVNNIFIGHDTGTIGSNNILIGPNQTPGNISNQLRIGLGPKTVIAADLSNQFVGINNANPVVSFDVSGQAYFRDKVGIQVEAPSKSLEVNGETYSTVGFLAGRGTASAPAYSFYADPTTGMYSPGNGYGSLDANGVPYITFGAGVINLHNRTLVNADISGGGGGGPITLVNGWVRDTSGGAILTDISEGNIYAVGDTFTNNLIYSGFISNTNTNTCNVIGGVVLSNGDVSANTYNGPGGTANAPHYTFSDDRTTGVFFPGPGRMAFTTSGTERMRISNSFVGIGTTAPGSALDVSGGLRIVGGPAGIITLSNGTINAGVGINISGTSIVSSNGAFSNASTTSNSIGGVTLSNTNVTFAGTLTGSTANTSNVIGGVTLSNSLVEVSTSNLSFPLLRLSATQTNTFPPIATMLHPNMAGGTEGYRVLGRDDTFTSNSVQEFFRYTGSGSASNSYQLRLRGMTSNDGFTLRASGVATVAGVSFATSNITAGTGSNNIGGVVLNASNITAGTGSNNIGGVVLNASNITAGTGSNNVGGVTLSNTRILAAAGTAAAPSYSFSDDLGVGMFDAGTNALGLATSGLERMRIDTSGNVGIGTATPFCRVQVVTPGSVVNEITSSLAESAADPDFKLVATKGNLGGGFGGISTKFGLVYRTGGVNTSNGFINFHRGIGPSDGFLSFSTSNIERMRIDPAGAMTVNGSELIYGNVGIGVTDPIVALDVSGMIRVRGTSNVSSPNRGFLALEPYSFGTTPIAGDTTVAQLVFSNDSGGGPWYATMGAVISNGGFADGMDLRFTTNRSSGDRTQVPRMTIRSFTGHVGIGTTNPAYALDVCSSAGVASVNMRTWPRFPVTNVLMAIAQLTQLGGLNGGAYNFSNPIQTMDTNLITFTASNASVGASFIIRRSGLWNINFLFHTGNAQYVFIDVSTGNVASNSYGSNGTRPIAFGGQGGGGVNMVTYTGYLPSNASYLYKFRGGSNLATVGLGTNTLQITFLGETPDSAAAFPF